MLVAKRFLIRISVSIFTTLIISLSCFATTYTVDAKAQPNATTFTSLSTLLATVSLKGGDVV